MLLPLGLSEAAAWPAPPCRRKGHMLGVVALLIPALLTAVEPPATRPVAGEAECLDTVRRFADLVLEQGRDTYGPRHTPLFVDGLEVGTHKPARWKHEGEEWILSNPASQQNLLRTLVALSRLSGDARYRQAAVDATRYAFEHLRSPSGLLYWGGHCAYDAGTEQLVGEKHARSENGGRFEHELKRHYPFYEFMWEVDAEATRGFLEGFWNAHILDWSNLEMNRHGRFDQARGKLWDHEYIGGPVFFPARGLSFVNTGSDLFYAGALLSRLSGDPAPLIWAKRMARRYVETRNPRTGLGGYQYTRYAEGDRAFEQFGPEFGERALEGTLLTPPLGLRRFALAGICQMMLGELLGEQGREFRVWALEDLAAYARWAYDPETNTFRALLTDGTILSPADVKRKGYFGPVGSSVFKPAKAGTIFLRAYAMAYRLSRDVGHWQTARQMGLAHGLGDIGERPDGPRSLNLRTDCADPQALHAALELHRACGGPFLDLAGAIAGNIVHNRVRGGLFVSRQTQRFSKFDSDEPLALLHYVAARRGTPALVPAAWPGESYFHGPMDGVGRTYDNQAIYQLPEEAADR